ncbi:hypothetical protein Tco_0092980 [Tanacetum coccineum]
MSISTHPIIVPSNSDIEDTFSSTHTPDYTPASPDYFPASPGNTSPDPLDDLSKYLLASLAISPFHDDPYMKVMQAYNATSNESPIPPLQAPIAPPTVLPPSLVLPLSPMFDPQDFFLPEEILPPQKRARFLSSSSDFSTLPQVFEIGESSHKTHLERHEEQIETILNHLDELPLERIEHIEDKIEGLEKANGTPLDVNNDLQLSGLKCMTFVHPQLVADSVVAALEAQAANMANTDNINRNPEPRETPAARKCTYKEFMSCQPFHFNGTEGAVGLISSRQRSTLDELKTALWTNKYCPRTEVRKIVDEFYNLVVKGNDLKTYARRFQELATLCPNMVPNNEKLMEVFIGGLPQSIEGTVTASKPQTLEEVINKAQRLLNQVLKHGSVQGTNDHKQKFND